MSALWVTPDGKPFTSDSGDALADRVGDGLTSATKDSAGGVGLVLGATWGVGEFVETDVSAGLVENRSNNPQVTRTPTRNAAARLRTVRNEAGIMKAISLQQARIIAGLRLKDNPLDAKTAYQALRIESFSGQFKL